MSLHQNMFFLLCIFHVIFNVCLCNVYVSCNEFTIALSFVDDVLSALESMYVADLTLKEKLPLKQHESNASLSAHKEETVYWFTRWSQQNPGFAHHQNMDTLCTMHYFLLGLIYHFLNLLFLSLVLSSLDTRRETKELIGNVDDDDETSFKRSLSMSLMFNFFR